MARIALILGLLGAAPTAAQERPATAPPREGVEFFEKKIRPLLVERCYKCHSVDSEKLKAGLRLDSRDGLLRGGESGPALVPGHPEKSLLLKAIRRGDDDLEMPPDEKKSLTAEQIADFETWIRMGAPDPRSDGASGTAATPAMNLEAARGFWSFRPPLEPKVPASKAGSSVDAFVLSRLEREGLKPVPAADPRTLLRRASYDLTGLPPTEAEAAAFLADPSPAAWEKAVNGLLASAHFGERWGRHWLDVARYADTKEWVVDEERRLPYPYTYRDWVIRAFNEDMPYDQFLRYQIAADRIVQGDDKTHLAALGFLTVGRSFLNRLPDIIDDRIDVVTRGTLGLTVQCARCHDHKYDPVPTKDYYSLYGIFASSAPPKEMPLVAAPRDSEEYRAYRKELAAREGEIQKFKEKKHESVVAGFRAAPQIEAYLLASREAAAMSEEQVRDLARQRQLNAFMLRRWTAFLRRPEPVMSAWNAYAALPDAEFADRARGVDLSAANPIVREAFAEPPTSLQEAAHRYGTLLASFNTSSAHADPGAEALRQALCGADAATNMPIAEVDQFLSGDDRGQMRKLRRKVEEMHHHPGSPPRAMTLEEGTAHAPRVFIRGNATTPGEEVTRHFLSILAGDAPPAYATGGRLELAKAIASPYNPLTARVMANRIWLHLFGQGIVRTPSDFGTRGEPPTHPELLDWLARRFVEDGWSVKDLIRRIMVTETYRRSSADDPENRRRDPENRLLWRANRRRLDLESMRDSILAVSGTLDRTMGGRSVELTTAPYPLRRTVYGYIDRLNLANLFKTFDFALPDMHSPRRHTTTVPLQALFLMNSPFVHEQAQALAARTEGADPTERIARLYRAALGRNPTTRETDLALAFVKAQSERTAAPAGPVWQYGLGTIDAPSQRVAEFTPLPHYTGSAWQGGPKLPDPKTGWAMLQASGGHAADRPESALVRRWTAPRDGRATVLGAVRHGEAAGDGVVARIISSRSGLLASWTVCRMEAEGRLAGIEVKAGETIDFVVQCRGDNNSDAFSWSPSIRMAGPDEEWSALSGFGGPAEKAPPPLTAWERYAQVLLLSNEFMFVD